MNDRNNIHSARCACLTFIHQMPDKTADGIQLIINFFFGHLLTLIRFFSSFFKYKLQHILCATQSKVAYFQHTLVHFRTLQYTLAYALVHYFVSIFQRKESSFTMCVPHTRIQCNTSQSILCVCYISCFIIQFYKLFMLLPPPHIIIVVLAIEQKLFSYSYSNFVVVVAVAV